MTGTRRTRLLEKITPLPQTRITGAARVRVGQQLAKAFGAGVTVDELAALTDRPETWVRRIIAEFHDRGRLPLLYPEPAWLRAHGMRLPAPPHTRESILRWRGKIRQALADDYPNASSIRQLAMSCGLARLTVVELLEEGGISPYQR